MEKPVIDPEPRRALPALGCFRLDRLDRVTAGGDQGEQVEKGDHSHGTHQNGSFRKSASH
jgi:hypothetical protein